MSERPRANGGDEHGSHSRPLAGGGERGREFNPTDVPADRDRDHTAPAPGTPVDDEEYARLKARAQRKRQRPGGPAQEDPGGESST